MDNDPSPQPLTPIDQALLRAFRVWGATPATIWDRFPIERRASLQWAWNSGALGNPVEALEKLKSEHAAQTRPDLSRVHVSWWVRSLREESKSIQCAVAANLPEEIAGPVRGGLNLTADDRRPDRSADQIALRTALHLWTVRFIGDVEAREDDPHVIAALTRLDSGTLALLIHVTGLAKLALTPNPLADHASADRERLDSLRKALGEPDLRFVKVAEQDLKSLDMKAPRPIARLGLLTFARLLSVASVYRSRWALQHVPYATAGAIRSLIGPEGRRTPMLARWEADLLRVAGDQLKIEGRLDRFGEDFTS